MSRQGDRPESRLVCRHPKRTRQQDTESRSSITPSRPRSLVPPNALKTLTSLTKEVRSFSLSDNSIWSYPPVFPLAITEGYFSLAIIAFEAFEFIVPKYYYRLGKMEITESRLLI